MKSLSRHRVILSIFLLALILRVGAALFTHYGLSPELQDKILPIDGRDYTNALNIRECWTTGTAYTRPQGTYPAYDFYVAAIINIAGFHRIMLPLANSLLGALLVFFLYDIAKRFFNERAARTGALLYACFPSLVFWSSQNLKDTPCLAIILFTIWALVRLQENFRLSHLAVMGVTTILLAALYEMRSHVFILLLYSVIFYLIVNISRRHLVKSLVYIVSFLIIFSFFPRYYKESMLFSIPLAIKRVFVDDPVLDKMPVFDIAKDIESIGRAHRRSTELGKAVIYPDADLSSPIKIVRFLPKGMAYFLFAPFPWGTEGLIQKITIPENILWYLLFAFALYGLYIYRMRWRIFSCTLFFMIISILAYSLILANFGTAYRQRAAILPFFFIFAAAGIAKLLGDVSLKHNSLYNKKLQSGVFHGGKS